MKDPVNEYLKQLQTPAFLNITEQLRNLDVAKNIELMRNLDRTNSVMEQIRKLQVPEFLSTSEQLRKASEQFKNLDVVKNMELMRNLDRSNSVMEQIRKLQLPDFLSTSEQLRKASEQFKNLDVVKNMELMRNLDRSNSVMEQIRKLQLPDFLSTSEQLRKASEQFKNLDVAKNMELMRNLDWSNSVMEQFRKQNEYSKKLPEFLNVSKTYQLHNTIFKYSDLGKILENFNSLEQYDFDEIDNIIVNDDGTVSIGSASVNQEEISEYINHFLANYESSVDFITSFFDSLRSLSKPVGSLLLYLILPYIVTIYGNLTTPYWEEKFKKIKPREVKSEIIANAKENYDLQNLKEYRFVYTKILNVRDNENKNSNTVDEIYFGKTVKIINKTKSWCLIEYQDSDTHELKQGWVFSRYLSKFE